MKSLAYFLYGADRYRLDKALQAITSRFLAKGDSMASFVTFDLRDTSTEILKQSLLTVPFLVSHRLFVLKYPFSAPKATQETLMALLSQMTESTIVVVFEPGTVDKRTTLFKWLTKETKAQDFAVPTQLELERWIAGLVPNVVFEPEARSLLAQWFGSDTYRLAHEAQKVAAFGLAKRRTEITVRDVEQMCDRPTDASVWDLTDAVRDGQTDKALRLARAALTQDDPFMVAGAVANSIRTLAKIVIARKQGAVTQAEVAQQTKLHPYVVKLAWSQATSLSATKLKALYRALLNFDASAKDGMVPAELGLSLLLVRMSMVQ